MCKANVDLLRYSVLEYNRDSSGLNAVLSVLQTMVQDGVQVFVPQAETEAGVSYLTVTTPKGEVVQECYANLGAAEGAVDVQGLARVALGDLVYGCSKSATIDMLVINPHSEDRFVLDKNLLGILVEFMRHSDR